jgi:hypothetical protein
MSLFLFFLVPISDPISGVLVPLSRFRNYFPVPRLCLGFRCDKNPAPNLFFGPVNVSRSRTRDPVGSDAAYGLCTPLMKLV